MDVGVGTICSSWRCDNCGWSEEDEFKNLFKKIETKRENKAGVTRRVEGERQN